MTLTLSAPSHAEPVVDRALSEVLVAEERACSKLKISFNFRVRYAGHVPTSEGKAITIQVRAVDRAAAAAMITLKREALRPARTKSGNVRSIELEVGAGGSPALRLEFDRVVRLDAGQGADGSSIIVALGGIAASAPCRAVWTESGWGATVSSSTGGTGFGAAGADVVERQPGPSTADAERKTGAATDEARAALKKGRHAEAIAKLRRVLALPENRHTREAQELLGTAYQKQGDGNSARRQFEDYVARYPDDDDSRRVRQRLRGLQTAMGDAPPKLRSSREEGGETDAGRWSMAGSFSQFYLRNDSFRTLRDPSLPPQINPDPDDHRVHQNSLLTGLDVTATWSTSSAKSKVRFSGTEEHDFSGKDGEIVGVAALYLETTLRDHAVTGRFGRQTESGNGVLGRFDGANLVWRASDLVRFGVVGGSPVWRRSDEPFKDEKYFVGGHVGFTPISGLDISLYGLEQHVDGLIDRRAIGTDLRYLSPQLSAFGTLDYDVHYGEFNLAMLNASWTFADKTVVYGNVDHRKSPFLTSWAALQGQPFFTLYDLLKQRTADEIYALALDRTATYNSAGIGVSRPLTKHWQATADVTWTNISATPASGGVPEQPGSGDDFYYSAQVIGTNLTTEGDMIIGALRWADRKTSDLYVLDLQLRYPLIESLRVSPRLRLGYLEGDGVDLTEYTVQPTLLVDYALTKDWHLETEFGVAWSERHSGGATETSTDLFFTIGYRYDFYADSESQCRLPPLVCERRVR